MDPARQIVRRAEETSQPTRGLAAITPAAVAEAVARLLKETSS